MSTSNFALVHTILNLFFLLRVTACCSFRLSGQNYEILAKYFDAVRLLYSVATNSFCLVNTIQSHNDFQFWDIS